VIRFVVIVLLGSLLLFLFLLGWLLFIVIFLFFGISLLKELLKPRRYSVFLLVMRLLVALVGKQQSRVCLYCLFIQSSCCIVHSWAPYCCGSENGTHECLL